MFPAPAAGPVREAACPRTIRLTIRPITISDFSGGLVSNVDAADLEANQSPDCENVKFSPGRLIGRLGWVAWYTSVAANPDGIFFFYDSNEARRIVVFANGNCYDYTNMAAPTLVETGSYTAGNKVCATVLNSKLYFSDGTTIHTDGGGGQTGIRIYDPPTSTSATALLLTSGTTGTIATPACKQLTTYAGSLVLGNLKYVGGTTAKHSVLWSNVNDPTTIIGTNIFAVGGGQGGEINSLIPFGVSSVGVTPYRALFVGKSQIGIYQLKGSLSVSDLSEVLINDPVGVLNGDTVQYVQGLDGEGGFVAFLGTDYRVHWTDGIRSGELSSNISDELSQAIADRFSVSSTAKFYSVRNDDDQMYVLDTGVDGSGNTIHFCYDWSLKAWTRYRGWPSGYWCAVKDGSSQNALLCLDKNGTNLAQANVGLTDNGTTIAPYWKTGWLHGSDKHLDKNFKWLYVRFATNSGNITYTAQSNQGEGHQATGTQTITAATDDSAVWDTAVWDSAVWAAGGASNYTAYHRRSRLFVQTSGLDGSRETLKGTDVQVKLSTSNTGHFEVLGAMVEFQPRGRKRVQVA